jgi:hypothetical protein
MADQPNDLAAKLHKVNNLLKDNPAFNTSKSITIDIRNVAVDNEKLRKANHLIIGTKMYDAAVGHKYGIAFDTSKSTAVEITNTAVKKSSRLRSILRLDRPHGKTKYNHININPHYTGVPDPHYRLPTGSIVVSVDFFYTTILDGCEENI